GLSGYMPASGGDLRWAAWPSIVPADPTRNKSNRTGMTDLPFTSSSVPKIRSLMKQQAMIFYWRNCHAHRNSWKRCTASRRTHEKQASRARRGHTSGHGGEPPVMGGLLRHSARKHGREFEAAVGALSGGRVDDRVDRGHDAPQKARPDGRRKERRAQSHLLRGREHR